MKCAKCNFDNREEAMFCKECGQGLAIKCPGCRKVIPVFSNFCDSCGRNLKNSPKLRDEFENVFRELNLTQMNLREARNMFERIYLEKRLEEFDWNISRLAEAIGIERSNLHRKIKRYNLKCPFER
jgi:DNA-binding NtrC family response regulator